MVSYSRKPRWISGILWWSLNTIEDPDFIIKGYRGALIALKKMNNKFLAVIYKELNPNEGFIITAYFTSKIKLEKEEIIWQKQF